MMRRRKTCGVALFATAWTLFGFAADSPTPTSARMMFGPSDAPAWTRTFAGFEYVGNCDGRFSEGVREPWLWDRDAKGGRSHTWANPNAGSVPADTLLEHGIACRGRTRLRIPFAGETCRVRVWIGDWFRGWNRLTILKTVEGHAVDALKAGAIRLRTDGRDVYAADLTPASVYREWCKLEDYSFSRKDDVWDRLVHPVLTEVEFPASVRDGVVELEMENVLLAAVAVGRTEAELASAVAEIDAARRQEFAKRYPWKPQPDGQLPAKAKGEETCLLFRRDLTDAVHPWTRPADADVSDEIVAVAAQGEQEAVRFGVLPLRDLGRLEVRIGDFVRKGGHLTLADNADVWRERYKEPGCRDQNGRIRDMRMLNPTSFVLQPNGPQNGEAGTPRMFVLDVRVPDRLAAGDWIAPVEVLSDGQPVRRGSVRLRVLPFSLAEAKKDASPYGFQMFYTMWPTFAPGHGADSAWEATAESAGFLCKYGFSNFYLLPGRGMRLFTISGELGESHVTQSPEEAANLARLLRVMNPRGTERFFLLHLMPTLRRAGWKATVDFENGRFFHNGYWDRERCHKMSAREWNDWRKELSEIGRLTAEIQKLFVAQGSPEIRWYLGGELSKFGTVAVEAGRQVAEALHKAGCVTQLVMNGPEEGSALPAYVDHLWANPGTPITEALKRDIERHGHGFGAHNCGDDRFMAGFHHWRAGFEGRYQETVFYTDFLWPYALLPWNYNTALVYPKPEGGHRPSLGFLAYRDARDDYLYMHALEKAIAAAPTGSPVRTEAEAFAREMKEKIEIDPRYYFSGTVKGLEGNQELGHRVWSAARIERVRGRAAQLLSRLATEGTGARQEVFLPCRGGTLETYFLDLGALKVDTSSLRLTAPDGREISFSLDDRLQLPVRPDSVELPIDGGSRHSKDSAPAEENRFRALGWLSFRAPADVTGCKLSFVGGVGRAVAQPNRSVRPWWIDVVRESVAAKGIADVFTIRTNDLADVSAAGGRKAFVLLSVAAPGLSAKEKAADPFWFQLDIPGGNGRKGSAVGFSAFPREEASDFCAVGYVARGERIAATMGSRIGALARLRVPVPVDLLSAAVQFPPETELTDVAPADDLFFVGDTLELPAPPECGRELLVPFSAGSVSGSRVTVFEGPCDYQSRLSDVKGSVVRSWRGREVSLDGLAPGVYTLDVALTSAGKEVFVSRTSVRIVSAIADEPAIGYNCSNDK